uniref:Uncharacterized protein n=1 Tax=Arundo donax TaxID=35708 RepID=A0A0A9AQH5_ARUDO
MSTRDLIQNFNLYVKASICKILKGHDSDARTVLLLLTEIKSAHPTIKMAIKFKPLKLEKLNLCSDKLLRAEHDVPRSI